MASPFWTSGPVPPALVGDLALERPQALASVRQTLANDRFATIGGPAGCGRTTLVNQVLAALRRPALVVASDALLVGDGDDHRRAVLEAAGVRRPEAGWDALPPELVPGGVLVFDGLDPSLMAWARGLSDELGLAVLVVGAGGAVPDAIAPEVASAFLDRRCRTAGKAWTGAALAEAVALAGGRPDALQRIGQCCLAAAIEARKSRIGLDAYLEGAVAACEPLPSGLGNSLAGVAGHRWAVLKAMVRDPAGTPTGWGIRCGLDPKAVVVHLRRLERHDGLVQRAGRGRYRIASPLVALHLQARLGTVVRWVRPSTAGAARRT